MSDPDKQDRAATPSEVNSAQEVDGKKLVNYLQNIDPSKLSPEELGQFNAMAEHIFGRLASEGKLDLTNAQTLINPADTQKALETLADPENLKKINDLLAPLGATASGQMTAAQHAVLREFGQAADEVHFNFPGATSDDLGEDAPLDANPTGGKRRPKPKTDGPGVVDTLQGDLAVIEGKTSSIIGKTGTLALEGAAGLWAGFMLADTIPSPAGQAVAKIAIVVGLLHLLVEHSDSIPSADRNIFNDSNGSSRGGQLSAAHREALDRQTPYPSDYGRYGDMPQGSYNQQVFRGAVQGPYGDQGQRRLPEPVILSGGNNQAPGYGYGTALRYQN